MNRRNWSSKSLGSRMQHAVFYRLISIGGWRVAYVLLFFVVLWYTLLPSVRRRSQAYRERRFPNASSCAMWRHSVRLHAEFGRVLVDRATAGITGQFAAVAEPEAAACLASLHREGRGLILLTGHIGCWQMAAKAIWEFVDAPVNILLHREAGDNDRHIFEYGNGGNCRIATIDPEDGASSAIALAQALQRGEIVTLMGDRVFAGDKYTRRVPFMGGDVLFPYNAYRLAAATGAPLAVTFSFREGPCVSRFEVASVMRIPAECGRNGDAYIPYIKEYVADLERVVAKHPYQFFNFFNMWEW